jgi:hypothetical protein
MKAELRLVRNATYGDGVWAVVGDGVGGAGAGDWTVNDT